MAAKLFASVTGPRTTGSATVVAKAICPVRASTAAKAVGPSSHGRGRAGGRWPREPGSPSARRSPYTPGDVVGTSAARSGLLAVDVLRNPPDLLHLGKIRNSRVSGS